MPVTIPEQDFNEFVRVDENFVNKELLTGEEIVAEVISSKDSIVEEEEEEEETSGDDDSDIKPPISEAFNNLNGIRRIYCK